MKTLLSACLAFPLLLLGTSSWAQSRLAVPSYQDPGSSQWNAWIAPGHQSVGIMIVNEDNGDDTTYRPAVAAAINSARANGTFVVGYVYTRYGKRDPAVVRNRVDAVYKNYLVDGIFFDEVPTGCLTPNQFGGTSYSHYQQLGEYVRAQQAGARMVILNPGTQPPNNCWMSIANILVTAESSSLADYTTNYQDQAWFHQYPPERFWHIVYAAPGNDQLAQILSLSQTRGAGWLYVTDLGGDNPYAGPPTYWSLETSTIASQGIQAVYATARPASTNGEGNAVGAKVSFRYKSLEGAHWEILVSSGNNTGSAPLERIEVGADGTVQVFNHGPDGNDTNWVEINAHAIAYALEQHVHLVELDSRGLPDLVTYQIRAFDGKNQLLSSSAPTFLSLSNAQYVFDVTNH